MMNRLIFFILALFFISYSQDPLTGWGQWRSIRWDQLEPEVHDSIRQIVSDSTVNVAFVNDTTELKSFTSTSWVYLEQLASANTNGGGLWTKIDSTYDESHSIMATAHSTAGQQWVRTDIINGVINVEWAGAIPNDSTQHDSNRIAIENAVTCANANNMAIIEFPAKQYWIDSVVVAQDDITFRGNNGTQIYAKYTANPTGAVFMFDVASKENIVFRDLEFQGRASIYQTLVSGELNGLVRCIGTSSIDVAGAYTNATRNLVVQNCRFYDFGNAIDIGNGSADTTLMFATIQDCYFSVAESYSLPADSTAQALQDSLSGSCIKIDGTRKAHHILIQGCRYEDPWANWPGSLSFFVLAPGANHVTVRDCYYEYTHDTGIYIRGTNGTVDNTYGYCLGKDGIKLTEKNDISHHRAKVTNNTIVGAGRGTTQGGHGIVVEGENILVANNIITPFDTLGTDSFRTRLVYWVSRQSGIASTADNVKITGNVIIAYNPQIGSDESEILWTTRQADKGILFSQRDSFITCTNNLISGFSWGIYVESSGKPDTAAMYNANISNNEIYNIRGTNTPLPHGAYGVGIQIGDQDMTPTNDTINVIQRGTIQGNVFGNCDTAIVAWQCANTYVFDNFGHVVDQSTRSASDGPTFHSNRFSDNSYGFDNWPAVIDGNEIGIASGARFHWTNSSPDEIDLLDGVLNLKLNGYASLRLKAFHSTQNVSPNLTLVRSKSNTIDTLTTTSDNDDLGIVVVKGVDSTGTEKEAFKLFVEQDGATGSYVPGEVTMTTYDSSGQNTNQLKLHSDGGTSFGGGSLEVLKINVNTTIDSLDIITATDTLRVPFREINIP